MCEPEPRDIYLVYYFTVVDENLFKLNEYVMQSGQYVEAKGENRLPNFQYSYIEGVFAVL